MYIRTRTIDRFPFRGIWSRQECVCKLEVFQAREGQGPWVYAAMATELDDNPGASITNTAEKLWGAVATSLEIDPYQMLMIEHYKPMKYSRGEDSYSLVTFEKFVRTPEGLEGRGIEWRHMKAEESPISLLLQAI
jgi:hypothetical protein